MKALRFIRSKLISLHVALLSLFKRFYRADQVRSDPIEGTGLGFALVHSILEAHQGFISATSSRGKGSTFIVRLPRAQNPGKEIKK